MIKEAKTIRTTEAEMMEATLKTTGVVELVTLTKEATEEMVILRVVTSRMMVIVTLRVVSRERREITSSSQRRRTYPIGDEVPFYKLIN